MTITKTIDTEQIKQSIDLCELAARYTELRKETPSELAGPCPKCGGDDRFHCTAEWFMCRQCHAKRGDAIEFFMWLNGVDFKSAVAMMTNTPAPTAQPAKRTPKRPEAQPAEWQQRAMARVNEAHRRLLDDTDRDAQAGRDYLLGRGSDPFAWKAFKLGFTPSASLPGTEGKQTAPAIVIPWYRAGKVGAVRYRFLQAQEYTDSENKERTEKQTALSGSSFAGVLYGGQALKTCVEPLSTLIICEGELNACSIWQIAHASHCNVLSIGGEDSQITPAMAAYAGQYARVLVWLDKGDKAQKVMGALLGAYGIKSPNGQDANDLLQAGKLGGFFALHRFQAAQNRHEQERLLWDLCDGQLDDSSAEVISYISKVLGVNAELTPTERRRDK